MFSAVPRWPLWGALRRRGGRGAAGSAPLGEGPASAECRTCSWRSAGATAAMDSPAGALKLCLLRLRRRHHPAGGGTERGEGRLRVRRGPAPRVFARGSTGQPALQSASSTCMAGVDRRSQSHASTGSLAAQFPWPTMSQARP